jgi:glycosyltransferase involved in cell wall biosynthesis
MHDAWKPVNLRDDPVVQHDRAPISVVIPTYNHGRFVLAAIQSARDQAPRPLEIIVVNDGSRDDTEERLAGLAQSGEIRYQRQANAGQAAARNAGAALARGRYLAFLDDDDLLPPDSLRWRFQALEANPSLAGVIGNHVEFTDGATIPPEPMTSGAARAISHLALFGSNPAVSPGQALLRRDAFQRSGGFAEDIWGADDWDLWFRLSADGQLVHIDRRALCYRIHADNASQQTPRLCRNAALVIERHVQALPLPDRHVIRFLSRGALAASWQPRLWLAAERAARERRWLEALRSVHAVLGLAGRRWTAAFTLKLSLASTGRLRLDPVDPLVAKFSDHHFFVER